LVFFFLIVEKESKIRFPLLFPKKQQEERFLRGVTGRKNRNDNWAQGEGIGMTGGRVRWGRRELE